MPEPTVTPRAAATPAAAAAGEASYLADLRARQAEAWPAGLPALNYTGGTTGLPKGCEHTQRHMTYTAACSVSLRPATADAAAGVGLTFIPVFWIAGENAALTVPVFAGSCCVLLMAHPGLPGADLSSLRAPAAMSFVTKLSVAIRERWQAAAGSTLREGAWGMTETHTIDTFLTGLDAGHRDLSSRPVFCGLPMPGTELKVTSFDTGELLPLGAEGEICVRTPSLLRGYWGQPAATARPVAFVQLRPGAAGRLTEDELAAWCREHMASYKVPEIRFVSELPLTATGKVKKHVLAGLLD